MLTTTAPTVADVERIVALDDQPVLRNLLITQAYGDLSSAMAGLMGTENANWCTFGCWASRTAGRFIRHEEVPELIRGELERSTSWRDRAHAARQALGSIDERLRGHGIVQHAEEVVESVVGDIALFITEGNRVVFADLGKLFAAFISTFGGDAEPDERKLQAFVDRYEIGEVQPDEVTIDREAGTIQSVRRGGESLLREMIKTYHAALYETDADRRAQLVLLANALGGLHEQTRLQTYIAGSLDAPMHDLLHAKSHAEIRERVEHHDTRSRAHALLDALLRPISDDLARAWEVVSTKAMMVLKLPDGVLWLGRDIPVAGDGAPFPRALESIGLAELKTVLEQYGALAPRQAGLDGDGRPSAADAGPEGEATPAGEPVLLGSAATDWELLSDRMRYIFELFRSRQQDANLMVPPFTVAQTQALRADRMPDGPLY